MQFFYENGKKRHGIEGRWRCGKKNRRASVSLYKSTIFNGIKISEQQLLRLAYCWSQTMKIKESAIHCTVSEKTAINWFKIFRRAVCVRVMNSHSNPIGDIGFTVEIDETHIFKRKYNVGRILKSESIWIVGGICRETNEIFLKIATRRNKFNLQNIIINNVISGSTIITDGWRGYWGVGNEGFVHLSVNHRYNFVDPINRNIHTQRVERLWRSFKEYLPKSIRRGDLLEYINVFKFKRESTTQNLLDRFGSIIETLNMFFN